MLIKFGALCRKLQEPYPTVIVNPCTPDKCITLAPEDIIHFTKEDGPLPRCQVNPNIQLERVSVPSDLAFLWLALEAYGRNVNTIKRIAMGCNIAETANAERQLIIGILATDHEQQATDDVAYIVKMLQPQISNATPFVIFF